MTKKNMTVKSMGRILVEGYNKKKGQGREMTVGR